MVKKGDARKARASTRVNPSSIDRPVPTRVVFQTRFQTSSKPYPVSPSKLYRRHPPRRPGPCSNNPPPPFSSNFERGAPPSSNLEAPLLPFRRPPPVGPPRRPLASYLRIALRTSSAAAARRADVGSVPTRAMDRGGRHGGCAFFCAFSYPPTTRPTATGPRRRRSELHEIFWSGF